MTLLEWLDQLIAFDTISCNSNLQLIECVQHSLEQHGILSHLTRDAHEPKANLFATLPAKCGRTDGGLILSGHTDVVPVLGQNWDTDPFKMTKIADKIYGRGTADMKGFLAVVLSLIPRFKAIPLAFPLHIALSYDEEIGCRGAPLLIADLPNTGFKPRACLVGEPTEMRPIIAHKGIQAYRCKFHGRASHSSLTSQGCNAIEYAAELICFIRKLADQHREHGPFDLAYDVPYSTFTTNIIDGGNAMNTIPALCEFVFEFRNLPETLPSIIEVAIDEFLQTDLLPRMRREYQEAAIILNKFAAAPGLSAAEQEAILPLVRESLQDHAVYKAAYATEAGLFQQAQIPALLCGPGSILQAHRANEFITIAQLEKCESFLIDLIQRWQSLSAH